MNIRDSGRTIDGLCYVSGSVHSVCGHMTQIGFLSGDSLDGAVVVLCVDKDVILLN